MSFRSFSFYSVNEPQYFVGYNRWLWVVKFVESEAYQQQSKTTPKPTRHPKPVIPDLLRNPDVHAVRVLHSEVRSNKKTSGYRGKHGMTAGCGWSSLLSLKAKPPQNLPATATPVIPDLLRKSDVHAVRVLPSEVRSNKKTSGYRGKHGMTGGCGWSILFSLKLVVCDKVKPPQNLPATPNPSFRTCSGNQLFAPYGHDFQ